MRAFIVLVALLAGCGEQTLEQAHEDVQQAEEQLLKAQEDLRAEEAQARREVAAAEEEVARAEEDLLDAQAKLRQRMADVSAKLDEIESRAAADGLTPDEQERLRALRETEREAGQAVESGEGEPLIQALDEELDRAEQELRGR